MNNYSTYTGLLTLFATVFLFTGTGASYAQAAQGDPIGEAAFTVVLDAGHGGHDPGNLGNGYLEKDIALNIVLEAGRALQNNPDVRVLYTRDDDTFVDLYKRGEIANKAKAHLFVSVHCDSHSSDAHGAGTFVLGLHANKQNFEVAKKENSVIYLEDNYESRYADYDINSPESVIGLTIMQEEFLDQSILLGKLMQERFTGKLKRRDRRVKQAGFIVLHQTFMPSVLVETGFLTNKNEGTYLNSKKGQQEMGGAIAEAILEYRNSIGFDSAALAGGMAETPEPQEEKPETDAFLEKEAAVKDDLTEKQISDNAISAEKLPEKETVTAVPPPVVADSDKTGQADKAGDAKTDSPSEGPVQLADKTEETPVEAREPGSDIYFKVQLMAVSQDMELTPANFRGLSTLSKEPVNNMYRILYGNTTSYEQAKLLQAGARQKGYEQAYIVAYRGGERIPVEKALQQL